MILRDILQEAILRDVFLEGGFPEYLQTGNRQILQELLNDILARDIIIRNNLRNASLVRAMALYLISNVGKEFTYNRLKKHTTSAR